MTETDTKARPANGQMRRNPPIAGELEAIQKAQAGDAESFEKLYAMHKRRVYSLCLRMVSNVAEAEDLAQEAFKHARQRAGRADQDLGDHTGQNRGRHRPHPDRRRHDRRAP